MQSVVCHPVLSENLGDLLLKGILGQLMVSSFNEGIMTQKREMTSQNSHSY